ncbi:hypothetical protein ACP70R_039421 [Stipagrostis hirtigluma subsp. patula]
MFDGWLYFQHAFCDYTLRKNKVLRMGSLGTQEPISVCASSGPIDQHSQETTFDQTEGASALLNHQYDCSNHEASKHNIGISEVHFLPDESSAAMTYIHPLSSCDYGSMASTPAQCSSDLETVLSPNLKQIDSQSNATDHSSTATDDNSEFLQLVLSGTDEGYISSEFQVWDVLDLYFPESFSAVQFNSLMGFTNDDNTSYHECVDAVDMAERSISSPILDKTREADCPRGGLPVDYATFHLQNKPSDSDNECSSAFCNVLGCECSNKQSLYTGLPHLMDIGSPLAETKNIVLVLDLDETLVHSKLDPCDNFDFTLKISFNMGDHTVYVRQRPHLEMFLEQVAQMFEVVIFTASERVYAEPLLDKLDPNRKLISRRLYRESCTFSGGSYIKDLTIFGVDLAKVVIIDNTPQVFQLQVHNDVPIESWFDDPTDLELVEILAFLATLVDAEDVRPIISKTFNKPQ